LFLPPQKESTLSYTSWCSVCVRASECERETEGLWVPVEVMLSHLRDRTYRLVELQDNLRKPTINIQNPF